MAEAIPVVIESPSPVPVEIVAGSVLVNSGSTQPGQVGSMSSSKPDVVTLASGQMFAAPTSTEEEERVSLGQRDTSMLWETTQAKIAIAVVYMVLGVAALISIIGMLPWAGEKQIALAITAFMLLSSLSTLVIGFYYGRTNHQRVGGVGPVSGR